MFIGEHKVIEVYIEHVVSKVGTYFMPYQPMGLVINEIDENNDASPSNRRVIGSSISRRTRSKRLLLEYVIPEEAEISDEISRFTKLPNG